MTDTAPLIDLIARMKQLDEMLDEMTELRKPIQAEYDKLRLFDIPDAMAEQGTTSIKNERFGRCTIAGDLSVGVQDKTKLHEWLNENGNGSLIVPTVNAQTLKAFVKEQLLNGEDIPEDVVVVKPFSRAVIYKS